MYGLIDSYKHIYTQLTVFATSFIMVWICFIENELMAGREKNIKMLKIFHRYMLPYA